MFKKKRICIVLVAVMTICAIPASAAQAASEPHFYAVALQEFFKDAKKFKTAILADLDGDGIDEVVAVKAKDVLDTELIEFAIFDVKNEKAITKLLDQEVTSYVFVFDFYLSSENYLIVPPQPSGEFYQTIFQYKNGTLTRYSLNVVEYGGPFFNGREITEQQYNDYIKQYGSGEIKKLLYNRDFPYGQLSHYSNNNITTIDISNIAVADDTSKILAMTSTTEISVPTSSSEITVLVSGSPLVFDQPPIIEDGRTLVPLRAIFEALGATVDWNQSTQTVTAEKDGIIITLKIGSDILNKNGEQIKLDVPAKIVGGRTLVPVRAVAESFGAEVGWDQATRTVSILE